MKYSPKVPDGSVNYSNNSPLGEFLLLAGSVIAAIVLIYIVLGFAVDRVAEHMPEAAETALGKIFAARYSSDSEFEEQRKHLQSILNQLAAKLPDNQREYSLLIVGSDMSNAFALPGGKIVMFSGLLEGSSSENEIAMVLGHELGHFKHKDHLRGLGRALVLFTISATVFGADSSPAEMFQSSLLATQAKFSRTQELRADKLGLFLLNEVYGHVGGATDFFARERKEEPKRTGFFASHPLSKQRIETLNRLIKENNYEVRDTIAWKYERKK